MMMMMIINRLTPSLQKIGYFCRSENKIVEKKYLGPVQQQSLFGIPLKGHIPSRFAWTSEHRGPLVISYHDLQPSASQLLPACLLTRGQQHDNHHTQPATR